ncbi:MAG: TonB-dependent receptor [Deltaproteobacteria bacterium]|nr:TonB-dependent receptor [Deltaproteobacteria bacterium]
MKKMMLLLSVLMLSTTGAMAEITTLDPVVVTATRQEEKTSKIPNHVTVLSADEISEFAAESVPGLLRSIPGVLVNDITGNGRKYTVDLRGFGETAAQNTLLLIDGRRINQADLSGVDWTLIPKQQIEKIEIIRGGSGGVLYGDNASAGVINIITKKGAQGLAGVLEVSAGSYDTASGYASLSNTINDLSFSLNSNFQTSDGYRENSDTKAKNIGLNLTYDVTDIFSLTLNTGYNDDNTGLPGDLTESDLNSGLDRTSTTSPDDYSDTQDKYLQVGGKVFFNKNSFIDTSASLRNRNNESYSSASWGFYRGETEIETETFSSKIVLNEKVFNKATKLMVGYDHEDSSEDISNTSSYSGIANYNLSKKSTGFFTHNSIQVTKNSSITAGYRKDKANYLFKSVEGGTSDKREFEEQLYTTGVVFSLSDGTSLYASFAKTFRYPVLDEMFYFSTNTVDTQLEEQTGDDFEIGFRHLNKSGLILSVNLFRIVTENEIFYNPTGGPYGFGANENLDGEGIRQGLEVTVSKDILDMWLSGSYTFRDTKINGGQYDGSELPNVPRHQATLNVQKDIFKQISLSMQGTYVGKRYFISDFNNQQSKQKGYFLLSGKLSYPMRWGTAYLSVQNILDKKYSEYGTLNYLGEKAYYPSNGINAFAGIKVTF